MTLNAVYSTQVTQWFISAQQAVAAGGAVVDLADGHVVVGDGNGSVPTLSQLIANGGVLRQVWSGGINSVAVDPANTAQIDVGIVIPAVDGSGAEIGPFNVTEFAIYEKNGNLCLVGTTNLQKTTSANGQTVTLQFFACYVEQVANAVTVAPPQTAFATLGQLKAALANIVAGIAPITVTKSLDANGWTDFAVGLAPGSYVPVIAATAFYVDASTGNDSNSGLTPSTAFATIQGAVNYISKFQSSVAVTINVAAGTYSGFSITSNLISQWTIVGAGAATTFITAASTSVNSGRGGQFYNSKVNISGFTISAYYECLVWVWGAASGNAVSCILIGIGETTTGIAYYGGASGSVTGALTFSGTFGQLFSVIESGVCNFGYHDAISSSLASITLSGSVSGTFIQVDMASSVIVANGYVNFTNAGALTGAKFLCARAGGVNSNGAGVNFFPGSIAGTATSPGYYT